jgi:inosine-uridine nucleoside N-ribohydrolase
MAYFEKGFHVSKDDTKILNLLKPRSGVVRAILDTDTYNEIDDQFALVQMMLSNERIKVEGIYAAPFSMNERADNPEKGMELSYDEILRLLERINVSHENFVFKGVKEYVGSTKKVVEAPAVDELIKKAHEGSTDNPLYVIAIGAISNVASALIKDPSIKEKIVVIWLGGNALYWPHSYDFNLKQDVGGAQGTI